VRVPVTSRHFRSRNAGNPGHVLSSRLEDEIERRRGCPAKLLEASFCHHVMNSPLAGLRPEAHGARLRSRGRRTDQRRCRVENPPNGIQVAFERVVGKRLDDHPRAIVSQGFIDVTRSPERIAHVVKAVEHGDEVVVTPRSLTPAVAADSLACSIDPS